ncbi:hypothetical protein HMPREF1318_0174 [Actinomyces massiliensis F0489]|uniref:Uncharacterized protein n=1 Tax=Actinomyces massiliensis F0489 TaxID=1125718 RepID=J0XCG3_9ACTO|nr:hypothetical protein HMPREF1318_0174 [Actinomyces massiliensis F0489]
MIRLTGACALTAASVFHVKPCRSMAGASAHLQNGPVDRHITMADCSHMAVYAQEGRRRD